MKTKISNSEDAMTILSENLEMLLTGKRKPDFAREVNNGIGKMISCQKTKIIERLRTGDKEPLEWFKDTKQKTLSAATQ